MTQLDEVIERSPVVLRPGTYCVARTSAISDAADHFMVVRDGRETTVITREGNIGGLDSADVRRGYSLIEIRIATPFEGVGFLATVCRAIAGAGLNILVVSTYSADYILLKTNEADTGLEALRRAGFPVVLPPGRANEGTPGQTDGV